MSDDVKDDKKSEASGDAADANTSADDSTLNVAALFAAVGAVVAGVAPLAATGLLGQIERNHGILFFVALGLTVGGTFLAAVAASGLLGRGSFEPKATRTKARQAALVALASADDARGAHHDSQNAPDPAAASEAAIRALDAADSAADAAAVAGAAAADIAEFISPTGPGDQRPESERPEPLQKAAQDALERGYHQSIERRKQAGRTDQREAPAAAAQGAEEDAHQASNAARAAARAIDERRDNLSRARLAWRRRDAVARGLGAVAILLGVVLAVYVAVKTATDTEKPTIAVTITPVKLPGNDNAATRTYTVNAEAKASNLSADTRITVLVDGLHFDSGTGTYSVRNLFHGKYGPDNDGKLDVNAQVQMTRGPAPDFDAVGVQASTAKTEQQSEPNPCGQYAKQVSTQQAVQSKARAQLDPGCVVVTLPGPVTPEATPSK